MTATPVTPSSRKPARTFSALSRLHDRLGPVRPGFDPLLALLSGLGLALCLSGPDRFWLAGFALVPLLGALNRSGPRRAFLLGALAGFVQSALLWRWVVPVTARMLQPMTIGLFFLVLLCCLFALWFGLLCMLIASLVRLRGWRPNLAHRLRGAALIGCLWVAFEYAYTEILTLSSQIFPMALAYSQWNRPVTIQIAAVAGIYGVSFPIVVFNAVVADSVFRRSYRPIPWATAGLLLCVLGGQLRIHVLRRESETAQPVAVAILQGNIPAFDKFDHAKADALARRYLHLAEQANRTRPDLIVWTETAIPWPLREDDDLVAALLNITSPSRASHILGAILPDADGSETYRNAVLLILPDGQITAQYDKRNLISFVERPAPFPLLSRFGTIHPAKQRYRQGVRAPVLDTPSGPVGIMICNENLYPSAARDASNRGTELMAHLANGAWFAEDLPIRQHFAVAIFRAVETGRDTVIANNVGISAIIGADGAIRAKAPVRTHACLSGTVFRRKIRTLYTQYGDVFAQTCAGIVAVAFLGVWLFPARSRKTGMAYES